MSNGHLDSVIPSNTSKQLSISSIENKYSNQFMEMNDFTLQKVKNDLSSGRLLESKKNSYLSKIQKNFEQKGYNQKSIDQLRRQIQKMKKMLTQLDKTITDKILHFVPPAKQYKGLVQKQSPEKQEEVLNLQIKINNKFLQMQTRQFMQLEKKEKELQERDNILELQGRVDVVLNQIQRKKKQKHEEEIKVQKLKTKLTNLQQENSIEYRTIKNLKQQIMFSLKKFHENTDQLQVLQRQRQVLEDKDNNINEKYVQVIKNSKVKDSLKSRFEELMSRVQFDRRRIQIMIRSQHIKQQKLQKQVYSFERQLNDIELKKQQIFLQNQRVSRQTQGLMEKQKVSAERIKSVSYKFGDNSQNYFTKKNTPFSFQNKSNNKSSRVNKSSYLFLNQTNESQKIQTQPQVNVKYINDKNIEIRNDFSIKKEFRIKRKQKLKTQNNTISMLNEEKVPTFVPYKFKKILSKKHIQ